MIAKEWRDARWKFIVGAVLVLVVGVMIPFDTLLPNPYSLFGEPENVIRHHLEKMPSTLRTFCGRNGSARLLAIRFSC
jgi:hypothetical protein